MRRILAAGRTDVGKVRDINEDALLVRDGVFAVADGMGGHLAGEVASATALQPIQELEGKVFADATASLRPINVLQVLNVNIHPGDPPATHSTTAARVGASGDRPIRLGCASAKGGCHPVIAAVEPHPRIGARLKERPKATTQ